MMTGQLKGCCPFCVSHALDDTKRSTPPRRRSVESAIRACANTAPPDNGPQSISLVLSAEVVHALGAVANRSAFVERAVRRELHLSPGGPGGARLTGRPPKHHAEELADCLGSHVLTTGEFQRRAAETLDISRATFYRLLERGRQAWLFRQRTTDNKWVTIHSGSISQNGAEVSSDLPDSLGELADRALSTEAP